MFFVKYGKEYLHDPRKKLLLIDAIVDVEVNSGGSFSFTICHEHPFYNKLKLRDSKNPITVWMDDKIIFCGDILSIESEFQMSQVVTCRGELTWLNDSIVRPYSTLIDESPNVAPNGVAGYFSWLINQHNTQVEEAKRFTVDINEGQSFDDYIYRSDTNYPTTWSVIKEKILDPLGGYVRIKHEGDTRYIDLIREYPDDNAQIIDFGVNLLDYVNSDITDDIASFVIPTGVQLRETWYDYDDGYYKTSDISPVADKEYYVRTYAAITKLTSFEPKITYYEAKTEIFKTLDKTPCSNIEYYIKNGSSYEKTYVNEFESDVVYYEIETHYVKTKDIEPVSDKIYYLLNRASYSTVSNLARFQKYETYYEYNAANDRRNDKLTLSMLLDGEPELGYVHRDDIIYSKDAVDKYGWIGANVKFDDISLLNNLLDRGLTSLKALLSPVRTIEITALDLSMIKPEYKPIEVGQYVRVRSKPHNFDSYMFCSRIEYDINKPDNNKFTLGDTFDTLTGQQNKRINYLNSTINHVYQSAEKISEEAKAAAMVASSAQQTAKRVEISTEMISDGVKAANDLAESAQESADNANTMANAAQVVATEAQTQANAAQTAADTASANATAATEKATLAKNAADAATAAATAADQAVQSTKTDLNETKQNLANVTSRVDANEADIAEAQGKVDAAQTSADNAQTTADNVQTDVIKAQSTIDQLSNMISHLITDANGGSLMTQTSEGWTFNMSSISDNLNAIKDSMEDMRTDHNDTNAALDKLTGLVNDVADKTAYITIATDDNGNPCIELGKTTNEFKVRITNTAIDFLEGSAKIAYANNNTFYATKMIVKNELQIGSGSGFVWKTRPNGNMGLIYISG